MHEVEEHRQGYYLAGRTKRTSRLKQPHVPLVFPKPTRQQHTPHTRWGAPYANTDSTGHTQGSRGARQAVCQGTELLFVREPPAAAEPHAQFQLLRCRRPRRAPPPPGTVVSGAPGVPAFIARGRFHHLTPPAPPSSRQAAKSRFAELSC